MEDGLIACRPDAASLEVASICQQTDKQLPLSQQRSGAACCLCGSAKDKQTDRLIDRQTVRQAAD